MGSQIWFKHSVHLRSSITRITIFAIKGESMVGLFVLLAPLYPCTSPPSHLPIDYLFWWAENEKKSQDLCTSSPGSRDP